MGQVMAYTVNEFCAAYGVGRTTAFKLLRDGELRRIKLGARTLIPAASAQEWFDSLSQGSSP